MKSVSLTDTEELYESFIDIPICQSNIDLYIYILNKFIIPIELIIFIIVL